MAILRNIYRSPKALRRSLLVAIAFSVSGCLVMQQMGWRRGEEGFSHRVHVGDEELECIDCHLYYEDREDPGLPRLRACMLCHDDIDDEAPEEKRAAAFYVDGKYNALLATSLDPQIEFSHLTHVTDPEGCIDCHVDIVEADGPPAAWMGLSMDSCVSCHEAEGEVTDCASCHADITTDTMPESHGSAWDTLHGLSVRGGACPDRTVDQCSLCHTEATCVQCHLEEAPDNHNNYWRRRGHGLTAQMDRKNCSACHEPDTCTSCHATAEPQSHNALWGSSKNLHCIGCHETGPQNSCSTCHTAGTPSHAFAPMQPPGHVASSDCRSCHTLITHVDNGADCNQCHH